MKSLRKIQVAMFAALMTMGVFTYGQSLTPNPSTVPSNAYISGSDEIHYFFQVVTYTVGTAPTAGEDLEINLPSDGSITVADPDADASFHDGIFITHNSGTVIAVDPTTTAGQIVLSTTVLMAAGEIVNVIFPVLTDSTLASTTKVPYDISIPDLSGDDGFIGTDSVSFSPTVRPVNLFTGALKNSGDTGYSETDKKGEYHPGAAAAVTTALTNFVVDGAPTATFVNPSLATPDPWSGMVLNGTDNDHDPELAVPIYEVGYHVWASGTPGLPRLDVGLGTPLFRFNAAGDNLADDLPEGSAITEALRSAELSEGIWYIYLTSTLSADWAIAETDTLIVYHYPVFVDPTSANPSWQYDDVTDGAGGAGQGVDYNHDNTFDPTVAIPGGDDAISLYLDTGNIYGIDGNFVVAGNSYDWVRVYWHGQDVDNVDATVQIFYSTSATLDETAVVTDGNGNVTALTGATEVTTSPLPLYGATNYNRFDIPTSPLMTADNYYFYLVANDKTNQTVQILTDYDGVANPLSLTVTIKHSPYLQFHDVYAAEAAAAPVGKIPVDTYSSEYVKISWGKQISDARDIDATPGDPLLIELYYVLDVAGTGLYAVIVPVSPLDPSALRGAGILITTVEDSGDAQLDNSYMWDIRSPSPALTEFAVNEEYHIYGVVKQGGDEIVVQYNSDGFPGPTTTDDRAYRYTHGSFFQSNSPVLNASPELVVRDQYRLEWNAFDLSGVTTGLIQPFIAPTEDATDFSASNWTAIAATNGLYWVDVTGAGDGSAKPANTAGFGATAGYANLNVVALTEDADAVAPEGIRPYDYKINHPTNPDAGAIGTEYDLWYYYSPGNDFTVDDPTPIKADGTLFFSMEDPGTVQNIRIVPNKPVTAVVGDVITLDVEAIYASTLSAVTLHMDVPADNLSVVDGGSGPFTVAVGTADMNTSSTVDNTIQMDLAVQGAPLDFTGGWTTLASFQVKVESNPAGEAVVNNNVTFVRDGDTRNTYFYDLATNPVFTAFDNPGAVLGLVRLGTIYGVVEVEGRESNKAQDVSILVLPTGSIAPISYAPFVAANDADANYLNGAQVTLSSDGEYSLSDVPTGEYDIIVKMGGYLDQLVQNVKVYPLNDTQVLFENGDKLFGGDIAGYDDDGDQGALTLEVGDNQIEALVDGAAMTLALPSTPTDTNWNVLADITGDDKVWADDWAILIKNTNRTSEGVTYKEMASGSNEKIIASLTKVGQSGAEVTYAVSLRDLGNLRGYAVQLALNPENWDMMSPYSDGLQEYGKAYNIQKLIGYEALFVSATAGFNPVYDREVELLTVTLKALTAQPEEPSLVKVSVVDVNGKLVDTILDQTNGVPTEFSLSQNYPNPFNPTTTISFGLPEAGNVKLVVYNLLGKEVQTLAVGPMEAGLYQAVWNSRNSFGRKVSSGVYFYRLTVDNKTVHTRKMLLMK